MYPRRVPYTQKPMLRARLPLNTRPALPLVALLVLFTAACAEPPSKEMGQAQGAIDAARAAGADQYAADELKAAVDALAQSEEAVKADDYRLALAHALDSREFAQNAAKAAVDARAKARGDAERVLAEATALLQRAERQRNEPAATKLPRRTLTGIDARIDEARTSLQEARTALEAEAYDTVTRQAEQGSTQASAAIEAIAAALKPPARKGRR